MKRKVYANIKEDSIDIHYEYYKKIDGEIKKEMVSYNYKKEATLLEFLRDCFDEKEKHKNLPHS